MPQQVVGGFLFFIFCKEWREGFFGEGRGAMLRDRFSDQIKVTFHIRQIQFATPLALTSTSAAKAATCGR